MKLKNKSEDVSEKQQRIPTQVPKTKNHRRVVDDEILGMYLIKFVAEFFLSHYFSKQTSL